MAASESYPEDLLYHPEHDWARIDGDEAVLGVTWYAQDALGELVHYEPPDVGATVAKDASYGEVESVKAVSDLISPLSGEVLEVNQKVVDAPETVNEDPYGDGWLIRIRMTSPAERDAAARRRRRTGRSSTDAVSYLSLTDADREAMLAAIGVASIDELFRDIPAGVRFGRELDVPPALTEAELQRHLEELAAKNVVDEVCFLGAGIYDHYVPAVVDAVLQRGELLTAYTPYQPEMSPGRPAGDLRVPDRDLRADRAWTSRTRRATTARRSPPTPASSRSTRRAARRSSSPRRRTRRCGRS